MADTFDFQIVTLEGIAFQEKTDLLRLRSIGGDIEILSGHTPLLTAIEFSDVTTGNKLPKKFVVGNAFLEVQKDKTQLFAGIFEKPEALDSSRAQKARDRANKRLASQEKDIDQKRARKALRRAEIRLRICLEIAKKSRRQETSGKSS